MVASELRAKEIEVEGLRQQLEQARLESATKKDKKDLHLRNKAFKLAFLLALGKDIGQQAPELLWTAAQDAGFVPAAE